MFWQLFWLCLLSFGCWKLKQRLTPRPGVRACIWRTIDGHWHYGINYDDFEAKPNKQGGYNKGDFDRTNWGLTRTTTHVSALWIAGRKKPPTQAYEITKSKLAKYDPATDATVINTSAIYEDCPECTKSPFVHSGSMGAKCKKPSHKRYNDK